MKRVIAIGDIHGCVSALRSLISEIKLDADDVLVPLGDYIDRGPHSRDVVDELLQLRTQCQVYPLLGNHESMLLMALEEPAHFQFWLECGGIETMESYENSLEEIPEAHLQFFRECGLCFETATHIFCHANYDPDLDLELQNQTVVLWRHLTERLPPPHKSGKTVVVGHTPQISGEILDMGYLKCIDTFCYGGQWLTALDVVSGEIWQASADGRIRGKSEGP